MRKAVRKPIPSIRKASGFALAAVLWLLAGLTILASMISQSSQTLAQRQYQLKQRVDAEQDFVSSRSEALYWISSSPASEDGFGWGNQFLRVDGRGYAGIGKSTIQIQDSRGLLGLNNPRREWMTRFLIYCGADESQTDALLDALQDYEEKSDLKRLNGAKSSEYEAAGLPAPRGAPLLAESEIWRVFGWTSIRTGWDAKHCSEDVTVHGDRRFNIGTATSGALAGYGLPDAQIVNMQKERDTGESDQADAVLKQDDSFMGSHPSRIPARIFRITHIEPNTPWVFRYDLNLRADLEGVPWQISSPRYLPTASVLMPIGRTEWPHIDEITETDKNAITQPKLPF